LERARRRWKERRTKRIRETAGERRREGRRSEIGRYTGGNGGSRIRERQRDRERGRKRNDTRARASNTRDSFRFAGVLVAATRPSLLFLSPASPLSACDHNALHSVRSVRKSFPFPSPSSSFFFSFAVSCHLCLGMPMRRIPRRFSQLSKPIIFRVRRIRNCATYGGFFFFLSFSLSHLEWRKAQPGRCFSRSRSGRATRPSDRLHVSCASP